MSLVAGTRLGPYEIQSAIGAGGMGEVYKARDTRLDRTVAIKVLPTELSSDGGRRTRFAREAKTIAGLNHPHICTLYDVGEHDGATFLVMELLEGEPLRARLSQGRAAVPAIVDTAIQLADALECAHTKGIGHRDIKPDNIFITTRGAVKLLDFGIVKLVTEQDAALTATRAGTGPVALGTLAYMSPEQVRAEPLDARTDLFSLGVVLYEMATGTAPFSGATSGAVLGAILTKAPTAPARLNPEIPADLASAAQPGDPSRPRAHRQSVAGKGPRGALPVGGRLARGSRATQARAERPGVSHARGAGIHRRASLREPEPGSRQCLLRRRSD
jgi:serine/threonine protein kinase